jgi:hypothetical protein
MKLHENKELFQDAVIATSQQKDIREIYVEKDYWVTFALFNNLIPMRLQIAGMGERKEK